MLLSSLVESAAFVFLLQPKMNYLALKLINHFAKEKGKSLSKLLDKMRTSKKDKNKGGHTNNNTNNYSGKKENYN